MRLLSICVVLLFITCASVKNRTSKSTLRNQVSNGFCLDTLALQKRDYLFDESYDVKLENNTPLTVIIKAIKDSISSDKFTNTEKEKLIGALRKVTLTNTKKLKTVEPTSNCGQIFIDRVGSPLQEINPHFNFYLPNGYIETKEIDKEIKILQKYKDSSAIYFDKEPFCYDKGSYFKLNKNQYFFNNYTTYSNDGGDFWITYKISNALDYNTNGWLKSAVQYRSFFKHYFSEEKRFFTDKENKDDYNDVIWHYTFFETQLDPTSSFINTIIVYYIILDNIDKSEESDLSIKKHILTLNSKE